MLEHHISVPRTARYVTLGDFGPAAREVWIVCHGYGQLAARFLKRFEVLDDGHRLVIAPEGLSRFYVRNSGGQGVVGASWMTREDRLTEIEDYVAYLNALYLEVFRRVDRGAVTLSVLGFSQGTATATRWIVAGAPAADRLVLWGGLLPPEVDFRAAKRGLGTADLSVVVGDEDQSVDRALLSDQIGGLEGEGVGVRLVTYAGGHDIDEVALRDIVGA